MGFQASELAFEAAGGLRPAVDAIKPQDAELASQLRRAAWSMVLNLEEGTWKAGRDRTNRYRIAAGSASEVRAALRLAVAFGYVQAEAVQPTLELLDRVLAILWKIVGPGT